MRGRVWVKSFGCATNFADGETIKGCLAKSGYQLVNKAEDADILIYNTCAVKAPTENRMVNILGASPDGKKIIVTGCLPLINLARLKTDVRFDGALGPAPGFGIVDIVRRVGMGERVVDLRNDSKPSYDFPKIRRNKIIEILPISYGCLGDCAYCCVRFARGVLRSYSVQEIQRRIKQALAEGVKEIWLTAQDSGCYGKDIGTDLAALLSHVATLEGEFFIRIGMMNPTHAIGMLSKLTEVYKDNEKIFKFLHLPIQSGDDEILRLMHRYYSADDFMKTVNAFRREVPEITIATDFICGFPGESEQAFERSMKLIEEIRPDVVNVSKFFARPKTLAGRMTQLPARTVKERSKKMAELVRKVQLEKNKSWIGWTGQILVDEKGSGDSWIGRNYAYKPVVVENGENLLGKFLNVKVKRAFATYLEAEKI